MSSTPAIETFPSPRPEREFEIANEFASGGKVKMMGVAVLPGQEKAVELYTHIIKRN